MSNTPNEQETSSPERSKQRQNNPVPTEINFDQYTNETDDIEMESQNHFQHFPPDKQIDTSSETNNTGMDYQDDTQNNKSLGVGYVGSGASFATRDSNETLTVVEEELSVRDHNFNHTIEAMDYTTNTDCGFTEVQNGSPNRTALRQRRNTRFTSNPYSVLESPINENNDNEIVSTNTSAKTDMNTNNE
jgi:hypothetical protein